MLKIPVPQWFLLNEISTDTHLRDSFGSDSLKKFYWNLDGKKYRVGNVFLFIENKDYSNRNTSGKKQNMAPMWKKLMKNVDLDKPTSFLNHVYLGCTQRECKQNEIIEMWSNCRMWNTFPQTYLSCTSLKTMKVVIKMIIEGRSPTMRHVSRTHRVALDWLFDRFNLDSKMKNQIC